MPTPNPVHRIQEAVHSEIPKQPRSAGNTTGLTSGQEITGFGHRDAIKLANAAAGSGTVTVATAGTVSIHAGGMTYNLDIAGAAVGETAFSFSNYTMTDSAAPAMTFLTPTSTFANLSGLPNLAMLLHTPEQFFSGLQTALGSTGQRYRQPQLWERSMMRSWRTTTTPHRL